ncbi:MAG: hypothetical protein ABR905_07475 [Terracidiphilus sp.]
MKTFRIDLLCTSVLVIASITVPRAYSQGNCAAVVQQESYNTTQGTHYFYGWASGQPTVEAAVLEARKYATQKRGDEPLKNDPASSDVVVKSSCGQPHGALAVQLKTDSDDGTYWYVNGIVFSSSEVDAKSEAVPRCVAQNTQTRITCIVIGSW